MVYHCVTLINGISTWNRNPRCKVWKLLGVTVAANGFAMADVKPSKFAPCFSWWPGETIMVNIGTLVMELWNIGNSGETMKMAICRYFRIRIAYRIDFWSVTSHKFPHLVNKQYDLPGDTDISNSAWAKLLFQQTHAIQNQNCAVNRALSVHTRTKSQSICRCSRTKINGKVNTTFVSQQPRQTSSCSDL